MKLGRRTFAATLLGSVGSSWIARFPSGAAEFNYRFSAEFPAGDVKAVRLIEAADKIRQDSDGRLDIRVYAGSTLGSGADTISQVRLGAIEFCASADLTMSSVIPAVGLNGIPFAFSNVKAAFAALAGPLGKYERSVIAKVGLHPFEQPWNQGFVQIITGTHPVTTPDDLKGVKMRVPPSPVMNSVFKAFGASPALVNSNEMYVALQTHLVDGIAVALVSVDSFKLYEVQKYVAYANLLWTSYTFTANSGAWQKLPKNLQDITERRIDQAALLASADLEHLETTLETKLRGLGMSFNQADIPAFRSATRKSGLYSQWQETYGSEGWSLLEKAVGKLG